MDHSEQAQAEAVEMLAYYYTAVPIEQANRRADIFAVFTLAGSVLTFVWSPVLFGAHGLAMGGFYAGAIAAALWLRGVVLTAMERRRVWAQVTAAACHAHDVLGLTAIGSTPRPGTSGHWPF